jgi:capsule polysaccharide export protein KpsE/RkpR
MADEVSLLEQVRVKELDLKQKEDQAKMRAEEILKDSRKTAKDVRDMAQQEGIQLAEKERSDGEAQLAADLARMKKEGAENQEKIRELGKNRVDAAAKKIAERVAFPSS